MRFAKGQEKRSCPFMRFAKGQDDCFCPFTHVAKGQEKRSCPSPGDFLTMARRAAGAKRVASGQLSRTLCATAEVGDTLRPMRLLALAVPCLLVACSSSEPAPLASSPTQAKTEAPAKADAPAAVRTGADGSLRIPFAGGSFATWNKEMPKELIEAAGGRTPERPVVVWAGNDSHPTPKVWATAD